MPDHRHVLECQTCGVVLQELSLEQAQKVAQNPYNYIGFCAACKRLGAHIDPEYWTSPIGLADR
jgi:hypothetical protein